MAHEDGIPHDLVDGPLARISDPQWVSSALVWWAVLDERFLVEVVRVDDSDAAAVLRIFDIANDERPLMRSQVVLTAGARFGPDIADVAAWQKAAIAFVDSGRGNDS